MTLSNANAAANLLALQMHQVCGEPDAADVQSLIEDGEALARIFDDALIAWATYAARNAPGNYDDALKDLRGGIATMLAESDFHCSLRIAKDHMEECQYVGDPHRSQRTHSGHY